MMVVQYQGAKAKWDGESWSSKDKYLLMTLNAALPELDYADITFGAEQTILDALPITVKVLKMEPKDMSKLPEAVY